VIQSELKRLVNLFTPVGKVNKIVNQ
jgi:hypothetical protein